MHCINTERTESTPIECHLRECVFPPFFLLFLVLLCGRISARSYFIVIWFNFVLSLLVKCPQDEDSHITLGIHEQHLLNIVELCRVWNSFSRRNELAKMKYFWLCLLAALVTRTSFARFSRKKKFTSTNGRFQFAKHQNRSAQKFLPEYNSFFSFFYLVFSFFSLLFVDFLANETFLLWTLFLANGRKIIKINENSFCGPESAKKNKLEFTRMK